jgi:hypothetical protein
MTVECPKRPVQGCAPGIDRTLSERTDTIGQRQAQAAKAKRGLVAAILITQNISVTCGTLLRDFPFDDCIVSFRGHAAGSRVTVICGSSGRGPGVSSVVAIERADACIEARQRSFQLGAAPAGEGAGPWTLAAQAVEQRFQPAP